MSSFSPCQKCNGKLIKLCSIQRSIQLDIEARGSMETIFVQTARPTVSILPIPFKLKPQLTNKFAIGLLSFSKRKDGDLFILKSQQTSCLVCEEPLQTSVNAIVVFLFDRSRQLQCKGNPWFCTSFWISQVLWANMLLGLLNVLNFINHSVFSKKCKSCDKFYTYIENNDGILNIGGLVVGHDVLQDYMYQFALGGRWAIENYNWLLFICSNEINQNRKPASLLPGRRS